MSSIVDVNGIEEGMVLAEPLVNKFGQTLMPAGAVLKNTHKRLLKTWQIRTVHVKTNNPGEEDSIGDEALFEAERKLRSKMEWEPREPIEKNLFKAAAFAIAQMKFVEEDR